MEDETEKLRSVVRKLEWIPSLDGYYSTCYCCSGHRINDNAGRDDPDRLEYLLDGQLGHRVDCQLAAALERTVVKCGRTVCGSEATSGPHPHTGLRYCGRCRRRINEAACFELVPAGEKERP